MADTHINVFVQELEDAYKKALAAVDELKQKADALYGKYKDVVAAVAPDAHKLIHDVEADVKQAVSDGKKAAKSKEKEKEPA